MKLQYRVVKETMRDDCDSGFRREIIGYFPSKKGAEKFVNDKDNLEMWKTEYKKVMSIITLEITIETIKDGDVINAEVYFLFE